MIAVSNSEESAKRHDRVSHLTGLLVDHQVVNRAQPVAAVVKDVSALNFICGDKGRCFPDGVHEKYSLAVVQGGNAEAKRKVPEGGRQTGRRSAPASDPLPKPD